MEASWFKVADTPLDNFTFHAVQAANGNANGKTSPEEKTCTQPLPIRRSPAAG